MTSVRATYRLQLRPGFGFDEAGATASYLAELGVSHIYTSPYLQAVPGSTHGYDVTDPRRVNEELGGEEGHAGFCAALGTAKLGQVLDLVPNHMAIKGPENEWWWDVLENGPSSLYAHYFDVDWEPPEEKLRNQILLPVLPDHYGRVLEEGSMEVTRQGASFTLRFADMTFPLSPRSVALLLDQTAARHPSPALASLARALNQLPAATSRDPERRRQRDQESGALKSRLARLLKEEEATAEALGRTVREANGDPDLLDAILEEQNYRLAYWRTGNRELDYRRFFDIDHLAALRVEDPEVFAATHGRVLQWLRDGVLDGLRIDHPDGLRNPRRYLDRLRSRAPEAWIVVEKILEPGELLRPSWAVEGTTGYDFLNDVGGLFVDPRGEAPLDALYVELTGDDRPWGETVREKKARVLDRILAANLNRLTHLFVRICERNRRFRDFTRHELREVLREAAISLPVYRTYVEEDGRREEADLAVLEETFRSLAHHAPQVAPELLEFFRSILVGELGGPGDLETELRMQFQQLTGSVMAKGVEDTAFYTYLRFVPLNEVGGDPSRFGTSVEGFHARNRPASEAWPLSMLSLSTHDTKRSEDVRARLLLISEIPDAWGAAVRRWVEMNEPHRTGPGLPDRRTEYLLYQTLVGAFPLPLDRARAFMEKAVREAAVHTSWTDPVQEYEGALEIFLQAIYQAPEFQEDLAGFSRRLQEPGRINSLAQKLLQLTAPGIPDIYQGTELWDLSLVDPDNRRPVDFDLRRRILRGLGAASPEEVMDAMDRGDPKMWLVHRALVLRNERPDLFGSEGGYRELPARGPAANHVVAFTREEEAATVVPRLVMGLRERGGWGDTTLDLPGGSWVNRMTGEAVEGGRSRVSRLLGRFPVALLARDPE